MRICARQIAIGINPPVPQERPVRAAELDLGQIAVHQHDLFLVDAGALDDLTVGGGDEGLAPELDAVLVDGAAVGTADQLVADSVGGADVAAVGDGVGALDGLPGVVLGSPYSAFSEGCQPMAVG
jgi:hypothetical protein